MECETYETCVPSSLSYDGEVGEGLSLSRKLWGSSFARIRVLQLNFFLMTMAKAYLRMCWNVCGRSYQFRQCSTAHRLQACTQHFLTPARYEALLPVPLLPYVLT